MRLVVVLLACALASAQVIEQEPPMYEDVEESIFQRSGNEIMDVLPGVLPVVINNKMAAWKDYQTDKEVDGETVESPTEETDVEADVEEVGREAVEEEAGEPLTIDEAGDYTDNEEDEEEYVDDEDEDEADDDEDAEEGTEGDYEDTEMTNDDDEEEDDEEEEDGKKPMLGANWRKKWMMRKFGKEQTGMQSRPGHHGETKRHHKWHPRHHRRPHHGRHHPRHHRRPHWRPHHHRRPHPHHHRHPHPRPRPRPHPRPRPTRRPHWPTRHPRTRRPRPHWPTRHPRPTRRPHWPTRHPRPTRRPHWPTRHPRPTRRPHWPTRHPRTRRPRPHWPTRHPRPEVMELVQKKPTHNPKPKPHKPKFCGKFECPKYKVVKRRRGYEIRCYAPATWAVTEGDKLDEKFMKNEFKRLVHYIKGGNVANKTIKMAVPVVQYMQYNVTDHKTKSVMGFYIPTNKNQTAPAPEKGSKVTIKSSPKYCVYVRSFGGFVMGRTRGMYKQLYYLSKALRRDKMTYAKGLSWFAAYNSPWRRWRRHNEVWRLTTKKETDEFSGEGYTEDVTDDQFEDGWHHLFQGMR